MKKLIYSMICVLFLYILCNISVLAEGNSYCVTGEAENITHYGAVINGNISDIDGICSKYGFEVWADNTSVNTIQIGTGTPESGFSIHIIGVDDNTYSYRTYCINKSGNKYYGEVKHFTTLQRSKEEPVYVNYNIAVENPDNISMTENPNKFLLNNLIVNRKEILQLIAGTNFDGIDYVAPSKDENIFINEFFMKHYYDDAFLRITLSLFDAVIYNRDDFAYSAVAKVILPDKLAYSFGTDAAKSAMMSKVNDPTIKRFQGAINDILSNDYQSTSKRTAGFDQTKYQQLMKSSKISKQSAGLLSALKNGYESFSDGLELYQTEYEEKILPMYHNSSSNIMKMTTYIQKNVSQMTNDQINEALEYLTEYMKEVDTYQNLAFEYEAADNFKNQLEAKWFSENTLKLMNNISQTEKFIGSTLNTIATIERAYDNKDYLDSTFARLQNSSDNYKLDLVLNDYRYKMNNNWEAFFIDTYGNIYNTFAKNKIKKALSSEIKNETYYTASTSYGSIAKATNKAISEAQWVLLAADAGGFFAEIALNTETILDKAIETKYLWYIENAVRKLLQEELVIYQNDQTEENAKNVIDDLYFLKMTKLRAITTTKDLYDGAGSTWISKIPGSNLSYISEGIADLYRNQRDALVNASISETEYTSESLTLGSSESLLICDKNTNNQIIYDGVIKTGGKTHSISDADGRVAGGVTLNSGSTFTINCTDRNIYIPYLVINSGASFMVTGSDVTIGELTIGGTATINGNVNISEILSFSGTLNVGGNLKISGNVTQTGTLKINKARVEIGGDYSRGGSVGISYTYKYGKLEMTNEEDYICIGGNYSELYSDTPETLTAGTIEIKGDLVRNAYSKVPGGTHKTILSGEKAQSLSIESSRNFNILEIANSSEEGVTFNGTAYVSGNIRQPVWTIITNPNKVKLQNKTAFVDYGTELNDKINIYVGNALGVTPTWLDYENYMDSQVLSLDINNIITDENTVSGTITVNNLKEDYENITCAVGVYSEGVLTGIKFVPISIEYEESQNVDFSFKNNGITNLKVFMWSGLEEIIPLCSSVSTPVK